MREAQNSHVPAMCKKVPGTYDWAGSAKGQSHAFECPECRRRGRFNTNFLGSRHVVCDGSSFKRIPDSFAALREAGVDLRKEAFRQ